MKAITHENLHHDLTTDGRNISGASEEEVKKPRQDGSEVETTVWVLLAVLFALVLLFGYLFWNKL